MLKYSIILIIAYVLYYVGNIVYDLFLKKGKEVQSDVAEEFSLADFGQTDHDPPSQIRIEDVENLRTPKSYLKREVHSTKTLTNSEGNPDLEELRRRFEAEQDLDEPLPIQNETISVNEENIPNYAVSEPEENSKKAEPISKQNKWKDFLSLAETTVKMVANYEGQKVYHSTM